MDGKRYNEEIAFRHFLHEKIANGKKLTKEERIWIETHKTFSARMGYPYLKLDYIELKKGIEIWAPVPDKSNDGGSCGYSKLITRGVLYPKLR